VDVRYRPATVDDAPALAEFIYLADQAPYRNSGYDLSLGGSREEQLAEIQKLVKAQARSWFHFSHFEVAAVAGRAVAGAAGFDRLPTDALIPVALREIGWSDEAIQDMQRRMSELYSSFPPEPCGYWTLDHVACLPGFRRGGLVRTVVRRTIERGLALGYRKFKLDVYRRNTAARKLYERLGFRVSETFGEAALKRLLNRDALDRLTLEL
jgi:ribosomal protein S18 acetylase RimI-like enzyme